MRAVKFAAPATRGRNRIASRVRLHGVVEAGLRKPALREARERLGATPMGGPVVDLAQFLAAEAARYGAIIRAVGIRPAG